MWMNRAVYWFFLLPVSILLGFMVGAIVAFCIACITGSMVIAGIFFFLMLGFSLIYTPRIWFAHYPTKYDHD